MKSTAGFVLLVLIIVGLLFLTSRKEYSGVPADAAHSWITSEAACMECHGPDRKDALKRSHPPKYECFKCHKPAAKRGR